jgi:hypothetical protein
VSADDTRREGCQIVAGRGTPALTGHAADGGTPVTRTSIPPTCSAEHSRVPRILQAFGWNLYVTFRKER